MTIGTLIKKGTKNRGLILGFSNTIAESVLSSQQVLKGRLFAPR